MQRDALVSEMLQMCARSARKGEAMRNKLYVGLLTVLIGGFLLRRQAIRWGATDEEVHKPLRGDAVVPHPQLETTHAVTINAPAMAVWPWLVQMGYDRAGWYLDARWWDWLVALRYSGERADQSTGVPGGRHNADWIVPEFERLNGRRHYSRRTTRYGLLCGARTRTQQGARPVLAFASLLHGTGVDSGPSQVRYSWGAQFSVCPRRDGE